MYTHLALCRLYMQPCTLCTAHISQVVYPVVYIVYSAHLAGCVSQISKPLQLHSLGVQCQQRQDVSLLLPPLTIVLEMIKDFPETFLVKKARFPLQANPVMAFHILGCLVCTVKGCELNYVDAI